MSNLIEKECEICGVWFKQTNALQKYCPDCRKKSDKKKKILYRNVQRNLHTYDTINYPSGINNVCENCGKEFISYRVKKKFCCSNCEKMFYAKHTFCITCGKPMLGSGDEKIITSYLWYCSDECREKHRWDLAQKNNKIKTCPTCGKQHIKDTIFCSRDCYHKSFRKKATNIANKRIEICGNCHKKFETNEPRKNISFCSVTCQKEYETQQIINLKSFNERIQALKEETERKHKSLMSQKENAFIEKNGLCSICKTSYKNCERMRSNFRYSPKGASFNGSVIVFCPKYTDSKPKTA